MQEASKLSKEIKVKLFIILLISNIFVFLGTTIFYGPKSVEKSLTSKFPKDYEQIKIQANLLTSFEVGKVVSIFNSENSHLADGHLVSNSNEAESLIHESGHIIVAIAREKIQSFDPKLIYKIYPQIPSLKKISKESYEVYY